MSTRDVGYYLLMVLVPLIAAGIVALGWTLDAPAYTAAPASTSGDTGKGCALGEGA